MFNVYLYNFYHKTQQEAKGAALNVASLLAHHIVKKKNKWNHSKSAALGRPVIITWGLILLAIWPLKRIHIKKIRIIEYTANPRERKKKKEMKKGW